MLKRDFYSLLLCLVLIASLFTGCGGASESTSESAPSNSSVGFDRSDSNTASAPAPGSTAENQQHLNTKLIYTASISAETTDFSKTTSEIESLVKSLSGYIEHSNLSGQIGSRFASYTLRIPQEHYADFIKQVGDLCTVTDKSENLEDISEAYFDHESRLKAQLVKRERLISLLAQATKLEDIISLESAIADVQTEIDSLQGTLNKYDSLVNLSTIDLSISEVHTLSTMPESMTFISDIKQAFTEGTYGFVHFVRNLLVGLAGFWPFVLIICLLLVLARIKGYHGRKRPSKNDWSPYFTKRSSASEMHDPKAPAAPTAQIEDTDKTDPPENPK